VLEQRGHHPLVVAVAHPRVQPDVDDLELVPEAGVWPGTNVMIFQITALCDEKMLIIMVVKKIANFLSKMDENRQNIILTLKVDFINQCTAVIYGQNIIEVTST
jgi:hypothetical protein